MMVGMMTIMIKGKITTILMTRMMIAGYDEHFHDDYDGDSSLMKIMITFIAMMTMIVTMQCDP